MGSINSAFNYIPNQGAELRGAGRVVNRHSCGRGNEIELK